MPTVSGFRVLSHQIYTNRNYVNSQRFLLDIHISVYYTI